MSMEFREWDGFNGAGSDDDEERMYDRWREAMPDEFDRQKEEPPARRLLQNFVEHPDTNTVQTNLAALSWSTYKG